MTKDTKSIIDEETIAELATSPNAQEAFFGKDGLIKQLVKSTLETALKAEIAHHLERYAEVLLFPMITKVLKLNSNSTFFFQIVLFKKPETIDPLLSLPIFLQQLCCLLSFIQTIA